MLYRKHSHEARKSLMPSQHLPAQNYQKKQKNKVWNMFNNWCLNFEHISRLVLVFLLLTLNMQLSAG